jgi:cytochrome c biogenesis factor
MAGYLRLLIAWVASVGMMLLWFVLISLVMLVAAYLCRLVPLAGRRRNPKVQPPT